MKLKRLALVAALGFGFAGAAFATPIAGSFFPGQLNQLSDNNAEYLVNANGTLSNSGDSKLDKGDRLVGMFNIDTIENLTGGGTNNLALTGRELTGIFDITVDSKTFANGVFNYIFKATAVDGTAVKLFDDGSVDYTRVDGGAGTKAARLAALMAHASDGLSFMTLGINQYWAASTLTDDISQIGALPPGQTSGNSFLASFDILTNNSGLLFEKVDCGVSASGPFAFHKTDVCGSGSLLGVGRVSTPFDSFSNVDFTVQVVPEPASLALLGLGLFGLGAARRRKS